jgi:thymidylate synthase (FAD)
MKRIDLAEGSYVELVDHMGGDLTVVNAARASFGRSKSTLDEDDKRLIRYLVSEKHMSPLRHVQATLRLHVSEVVMRQIYKHQVGAGWTGGWFREPATVWNEISGRYTKFQDEYYYPSEFRPQHQSNRQASVVGEVIDQNDEAKEVYAAAVKHAHASYLRLLELGVCREQARLVVPTCFMNTTVWTASLEALVHFIRLRDHEGAQWETREVAKAVRMLIEGVAPYTVSVLLPNKMELT